ncbi:MAG: hypothetical protein K6F50_00520 [Kiritimatiellae bacterium]|nr:hypothetical protein [Kiritimatiellia bacterium]
MIARILLAAVATAAAFGDSCAGELEERHCEVDSGEVAPEIRRGRGIVTFSRGGDRFAFVKIDGGRCVRLFLKPGHRVRMGDRVRFTGRLEQDFPTYRLTDVCAVKVETVGTIPCVPTTLTKLHEPPRPDDPDRPDLYGMPVDVVARVQDVNRRRTQVQLFLREPDGSGPGVTASFPLDQNENPDPDLRPGAIVRLRGVASLNYTVGPDGSFTGVENLTFNIFSRRDVVILNRPPWWTPARIGIAAGIGAFMLVVLVVSTAILAWAVKRQTARLERTIEAKHRDKIAAEAARRERLRLAHDLHDEFQQLLTGTMFQLNAGMNILEDPHNDEEGSTEADAFAHLEAAKASLQRTQLGLRSVLWTMREESEGPAPLIELFKYAAGRMAHWKNRVSFSQTGKEHSVARNVSGSLLMILQEAVGNALRHGKAEHVDVMLAFGGKGLKMTVLSDGERYDAGSPEGKLPGHFGLAGMRLRAEELGGTFSIKPGGDGEGAVVEVGIPYEKGEDNG